eukprot:TRINITY_DN28638_c0_g1_i1.p1 TRINITY_DN28638_c0_g1~~TRINITY_DN28638_c0_g1_i1.p1  ORF type:complete len:216 (+),score=35.70 TRINITY_DN28638_c0_g1_i1:74-721(+)
MPASAGFCTDSSGTGSGSMLDRKAIRKIREKAPKILKEKVSMASVNLPAFRGWLEDQVLHATGTEDDMVVDTIYNFLEADPSPCPYHLLATATAFLGDAAAEPMCTSLWCMLLIAQNRPDGVPPELAAGAPPREPQPPQQRRDGPSTTLDDLKAEVAASRRKEPRSAQRRPRDRNSAAGLKRGRDDRSEERRDRRRRRESQWDSERSGAHKGDKG